MIETPKPDKWDKMASANTAERDEADRDKLHDNISQLRRELAAITVERDELKHEVAFRRDDSVALANARERIRSLEMDLDEKQRPLDAEMSRLNENLIAANDAALLAAMERDKLSDVLQRHGFVRCDIPACNCGSWHPRYGLTERMQEIKDALAEAGHELDNSNGNLPLNALRQLISERDEILQRLINIGSICASGSNRPADEANSFERWAELLLAERDRMRPVVEAAQNFRRPTKTFYAHLDALNDAVDTYEAAK